jgi:outer membrane protein OmpA-like peptidoglycan-associated protein
MRKYFFVMVYFAIAVVITCSGGQNVQSGGPDDAFMLSSNQTLSKIPVRGFGYKSSALSRQEWNQWAKAAAPAVKDIIAKMPDGCVLQVTGHADAVGPEDQTGPKPGNIKISTDRAKIVYDALKRNGIDSPKMTYKGIGSSETSSECDSREACQRRVTFRVVPQK